MAERLEVILLKNAKAWYQPQNPILLHDTATGICAAIRVARDAEAALHPEQYSIYIAASRIFEHIDRLLDHRTWLNCWLVANGHTTHKFLKTPAGKKKVFETRLAWFDDMIEYWENYDKK